MPYIINGNGETMGHDWWNLTPEGWLKVDSCVSTVLCIFMIFNQWTRLNNITYTTIKKYNIIYDIIYIKYIMYLTNLRFSYVFILWCFYFSTGHHLSTVHHKARVQLLLPAWRISILVMSFLVVCSTFSGSITAADSCFGCRPGLLWFQYSLLLLSPLLLSIADPHISVSAFPFELQCLFSIWT